MILPLLYLAAVGLPPELDQAQTPQHAVQAVVASTWKKEVFSTDPTKPLWDGFKKNAQTAPANFKAPGLSRVDYLRLISSEVDFWKNYQNADGAIIDPYLKSEFHIPLQPSHTRLHCWWSAASETI